MRPARLAAWVASGFAGAALVAFLLVNARPIDPIAHSRVITNLSKMQELGAQLDEDVLKLREALLTSYDPLVATLNQLRSHQRDLERGEYAVSVMGSELAGPMTELAGRLAEKEQLIEKFKSRNALLRNSFHYLPLSAKALLNDRTTPRLLRRGTRDLLRDVLLLRLGATPSDYVLLGLEMQQLRALGAGQRPQVRATLDALLAHAESVTAQQAELDRLVRELTAARYQEAGRALAAAYNGAFEKRLKQANYYRFLLVLFTLTLLSYAVYSFLRLRKNTVQLRQAYERQAQSEERYRTLFDLSPDAMLIHTDGIITLVNGMCVKMFGAARAEDLLGRPMLDLFHPDERDFVRERMRRTQPTERPSHAVERKILTLGGGELDVELATSPFVHQGKPSVQVVMRDISERKKADERLNYLAQYDSLTTLPNRGLFRDRLEHSLAQAGRSGRALAVLFIDLDRFKMVNDTLGHAVGDKLLQEAARRLNACVRSGDTVGRFGGDEFGVILTDLAKPGDAGMVAQKINDSLARAFELDGKTAFVGASIGIALYPADATDASTLNMNADAAMYRAKESGRNNYQFFKPEMNERAVHRMQMEAAMRRALQHGEFVLHYQPKVNLASGRICGVEALLRWSHPQRGLVSPAEFVPVLEDTGLIIPVGEWVTREACRQMAAWKRAGLEVPPVAVNLSARQFQQKNLEQTVRDILAETGVEPALLQFEITESLLMNDPAAAERILHGLKAAGVKLSVDDFGTGYSSLAYLRRFPLDVLKVDRAFIKDVVENPDDAAITLAVINLAHSLDLKVVAEGVETGGQVNLLALHSCDEIQGFYFSKAVPPEEIEAMVRAGRRLEPAQNFEQARAAVLLVDDSEEDLEMLRRTLRAEDFPVLTATTAQQAFMLLATHPVRIVVSDQRMPGLDGAHFLAKLGKLYPNVVRVAITGAPDHDVLAGAVNRAGIHKFLSKAWDRERLRTELREAYQHAFEAPKPA